MVRMSRHGGAVAVSIAAVLGGIAGAVTLPTVRQRLRGMLASATTDPIDANAASPSPTEPSEAARTPPAPEDSPPADPDVVVEDGSNRSLLGRAMALAGRSFTAVIVLIALALVTVIYAAVLRPDTALPQPASSSIQVTFGPTHLTSSPITMSLSLGQGPSYSGGGTTVTLDVTLIGTDFKYPGWQLLAYVPTGVHLVGSPNNNPQTGQLVPHLAAGGASVYVKPGAQRDGTYSMSLYWNDLNSGPLRVRGANLVASFPDVAVENQDASPVPPPNVTLSRQLQPGSDYAYLGGPPPDHQDRFTWSWNPQTVNGGSGTAPLPSLTLEARSATVDEQSHNDEFLSGILFGVAAAAFIAAIQELMNSARRRKRETDARPSGIHAPS
jgi:hypothetical protein